MNSNFYKRDWYLIIKKGSFGRVRLAKHKKTAKIYAIKMLKKSEIIRLKQVDHIHSEYNILSQLSHPFIVKNKFNYFRLK